MSQRAMNPILALDFGRARIGTAISDELQLLAHPLETIPANEQALSRLTEIVRERKIDHVVAGVPRRMNGQIGTAAAATVAAQRALRDAGKKTRDTRGYIDQVAAQMILQSYLDRRAANVESKSDQ